MRYQIAEVRDADAVKAFHKVPHLIYQGDPNWSCPLEEEVESIFNPDKNPRFKFGEAARWIVKDEKGSLLGRVAAFYNSKTNEGQELAQGGMGFFECVNREEVAFLLFDQARAWLTEKGMDLMDGPINFGDNDTFWGLLVEGFTPASYGMNYNPAYYQAFFEKYGFKLYYEQVSKHLDISQPMPERFLKIAQWVAAKPGVRFDYARKNNLKKYGNDFMDIYNDAWKFHENFSPLTEKQMDKTLGRMRHVLIEKFMIFAYVNEEPAGFVVCLPDLNQIFKPFDGKFSLLRKLRFKLRSRNNFAWYRNRGLLTRGRVVIIGIRPKFQKYGLESGLIMFSMEDGREMGFKEIELSWVGDFNPMSRKLQDATGAKLAKIHHTYRLFFDPGKEAERRKSLEADPRKKAKESSELPQ